MAESDKIIKTKGRIHIEITRIRNAVTSSLLAPQIQKKENKKCMSQKSCPILVLFLMYRNEQYWFKIQ